MTNRKMVRMDESSNFIFQEVGMSYNDPNWECYDFVIEQWVPMEEFWMFWANPFPYPEGKTFTDMVITATEHLPPEAEVYYYSGNESFCALRKKNSSNSQ